MVANTMSKVVPKTPPVRLTVNMRKEPITVPIKAPTMGMRAVTPTSALIIGA